MIFFSYLIETYLYLLDIHFCLIANDKKYNKGIF